MKKLIFVISFFGVLCLIPLAYSQPAAPNGQLDCNNQIVNINVPDGYTVSGNRIEPETSDYCAAQEHTTNGYSFSLKGDGYTAPGSDENVLLVGYTVHDKAGNSVCSGEVDSAVASKSACQALVKPNSPCTIRLINTKGATCNFTISINK